MSYQYQCSVTPWELWKLTMRQTYRSLAGVCNLVFTAAMIVLAVRFWNEWGGFFQIAVLSACFLFPAIQPIAVYRKAKKQAAAMPKEVELKFDDTGLLVTVGAQREKIPWKRIRIRKQADMVIVFSDARHGYLLTNRVLGQEKEAFSAYAEARIEKNK